MPRVQYNEGRPSGMWATQRPNGLQPLALKAPLQCQAYLTVNTWPAAFHNTALNQRSSLGPGLSFRRTHPLYVQIHASKATPMRCVATQHGRYSRLRRAAARNGRSWLCRHCLRHAPRPPSLPPSSSLSFPLALAVAAAMPLLLLLRHAVHMRPRATRFTATSTPRGRAGLSNSDGAVLSAAAMALTSLNTSSRWAVPLARNTGSATMLGSCVQGQGRRG